ncbi:hypothetical protein C8F04DRAFT_1187239 [Mycena alexandri]|uniref:Uncharacterized protein n=1 Tax=Mycena alexandri TaxID=1745969 RepID=A0AAD6SKY7_9AGAR|nr:hypothetical protein C8F04DRAFT_1187239 [Mycena alexandri]
MGEDFRQMVSWSLATVASNAIQGGTPRARRCGVGLLICFPPARVPDLFPNRFASQMPGPGITQIEMKDGTRIKGTEAGSAGVGNRRDSPGSEEAFLGRVLCLKWDMAPVFRRGVAWRGVPQWQCWRVPTWHDEAFQQHCSTRSPTVLALAALVVPAEFEGEQCRAARVRVVQVCLRLSGNWETSKTFVSLLARADFDSANSGIFKEYTPANGTEYGCEPVFWMVPTVRGGTKQRPGIAQFQHASAGIQLGSTTLCIRLEQRIQVPQCKVIYVEYHVGKIEIV